MASTGPVVNTAEEAAAVRSLLKGKDPRVLLVTSAFHMKRAQRLFQRQGIQVIPFPVDFRSRGTWAGAVWADPMQWVPTAGSLQGSSVVLREFLGRMVYRVW